MHSLVFFIALMFCLWIGHSIFIPLLFAAFLWYLINAIAAYYRKIMPCYEKKDGICTHTSKLFNVLSSVLSFATIFGLIYLFATQIKPMLTELYAATPVLQQKLLIFSNFISSKFGITVDMNLIPNLTQIAGYVGSSLAGIATSTGMVLIYLIFMFIEQSSFSKKINSMPLTKIKAKKLRFILSSIDENMKKYLFTKTFISAATGLSAYIALKVIGLEYASVWAFIIFV